MWLINRVQPSFKTIADFRKDHADAIVRTCRAFVLFCRRQSLMAGETVAIDGTKIAAVANFKQGITGRVSRTEQKKESWTKACPDCPLKAQGASVAGRSIVRSFHEEARQAMHERAVADPKWMRLRRAASPGAPSGR